MEELTTFLVECCRLTRLTRLTARASKNWTSILVISPGLARAAFRYLTWGRTTYLMNERLVLIDGFPRLCDGRVNNEIGQRRAAAYE